MTCGQRMRKTRFIAILRHIAPEYMSDAAKALYEGGVRVFEVTFDPSDVGTERDTAKSIETIRSLFGDEVSVGAGTVLYTSYVDEAKNAGGEFVVSPVTDKRIIDRAKEKGLLTIPGAFSPNEIVRAFELGGDIIKIFPILPDGEAYLRNVISPLSHIPFIVTGGINPETIGKFLSLGPVAVAAGASIITPEDCRAGDYRKITRLAKLHTEASTLFSN